MGLTVADVKKLFTKRLILNIIAILNGLLLVLFFELLCPIVKRGFFCGDPELSLPYKADTVSNLLNFLAVVLICSIIWIVELLCVCLHKTDDNPWRYNEVVCRSFLLTVDYLFGWILTVVIVDLLKATSGELRPHFFQTCQPHTALNCTKGTFIADFHCTNHEFSSSFHRLSITSFPSGHAAFSFYAVFFIIWYLQVRTKEIQAKFLIPIIQLVLLMWPIFCSVSRVFDNRHHWVDVIAGSLIGVLISIYTCLIISKNFQIFECARDPETISISSEKKPGEIDPTTQQVEIEMEDKEDMTQHVGEDLDKEDETKHEEMENEDKDEGSLHDANFQDAAEKTEVEVA